jgi:hypothetical protein
MIFGRVMALGLWNLTKYLVVTTFFLLCLEILTWFLVWKCIIISYRSNLKLVPVKWYQSPRSITRPKIIGPERNVNLICNLSLYTHISNIKSISQSIAKQDELWANAHLYSRWALKFGQIFSCHHFFFTMIWDIDLIFGMWI